MDRRILFIFLLIVRSVSAQIPNGGFESWTNGNPDFWQTTNIPIVPNSIIQDTNAFDGTVSLKGIVVSNNFNQPFPPYLAISGSGALGFINTHKYESARGWYKLFLIPGDKFIANVRMYNSQSVLVAEGSIVTDGCAPAWTSFNILINYISSAPVSTCTMYFTITDSSGLSSGHIGSYFNLDDLSLSGTVGINEVINGENISVFPNPADKELSVIIPNPGNEMTYTLNDISGKVVMMKTHCDSEEKLSLENLSPGIYFLNVISDEKIFQKKVIVN